MEPIHHPDQSTILAYAAGSLNENFALVIAAHLERCAKCRTDLQLAERLGGSLLDSLPPAVTMKGGLHNVWEAIESQTGRVQYSLTAPTANDTPGVLAPFFSYGLADLRWRTLVPGIQHFPLPGVESGEGGIRMLRISRGVKIPEHTHMGAELTLILQGSYSDETGEFKPGDLSDLDSSVRHRPVVDSEQPCVCLIATDRRLVFTNVLNRMLQPLIGI